VIFVINHLILALLNNSDFSDRVRTILVLEEAHLFISRQRESRYDLGEAPLYSGFRLSRKIGLNFVLVSQTISNFSASTLGNLNLLALGKLTNGPCVRAAALRLGLDDEQIKSLQGLQQRQFLVVTPNDPEPKLLEVPFIERPSVDYREIASLAEGHLSRIPFIPFDPVELNPKPKEKKDDNVKKLLRSFLNSPFIPMRERGEEMGLHPEEMAKWMKRLEEMGLIVRQSFGLGQGQPKVGALLTEKGLSYINEKKNIPGRGSLQARYIVHMLKEVFKNSIIEVEGCDLAVYSPEGKIAIEVEISADEHFLENVRRNLSCGFSKVIVVGMSPKDVEKMKKKSVEGNVTFMTVKEALNGSLG